MKEWPVPTAFGRPERMWPWVAASVLFHVALVTLGVMVKPRPTLDLDRKPTNVKLVRLGEKRPEQYLPRKEAPPPPAATAPAPAPTPVAEAAPPAPARPAPGPAKPAPRVAATPGPTKPGAVRDASFINRMLANQAKTVEDTRWGAPDGDPEGDASDGAEGDRYLAAVHQRLRQNYSVPLTLSKNELVSLTGTVVLFIDAEGKITDFRIERSSGNAAFDAALERTVRQTRLPPPPDGLRQLYRRTGVEVVFRIG